MSSPQITRMFGFFAASFTFFRHSLFLCWLRFGHVKFGLVALTLHAARTIFWVVAVISGIGWSG